MAKESGKWGNVYGMQDKANIHHEYFAEAFQAFFTSQRYFAKPNGWEGPITNPKALKEIDPTVYNLIKSIMPCVEENEFIDRCTDSLSGQSDGVSQVLLMDEFCLEEEVMEDAPDYPVDDGSCQDKGSFNYCHYKLKSLNYCDPSYGRVSLVISGTINKKN
jgi:hypothetical protein